MVRPLHVVSLLAIFFFLLLTSVAFVQTQAIFSQPPAYPGTGVTASGDFNQDGKLDLVTADGTVLLGKGDGTFRSGVSVSATDFNLRNSPNLDSVAVEDFNGDGKLDILLGSTATTDLYVFLGKGDGTFQPVTITNTGVLVTSFAVADVNGDHIPDVVATVANGSGTTVWVFVGKSDDTFSVPGTSFTASNIPIGLLLLGDFNGDGKIDVALTGAGSGTAAEPVVIMLGDGHGSFQAPIISSGVINPQEMIAGDFNGDGHLDLVISSFSAPFETYLLLGSGNGHFQAPAVAAPEEGVITAADLNGDGILDLAIGTAPSVDIFLGKGDGSFVSAGNYLYGFFQPAPDVSSIVAADFNGDGKTDLAAQGTVLLGHGDGMFSGNFFVQTSPSNLVISQTIGQGGVTGDFNGDGKPDVISFTQDSVSVSLGDGTGKLSLAHRYVLTGTIQTLATASLRNNGIADLVVITTDASGNWTLNVMLGNGGGSFGAPASYPQAVPFSQSEPAIALADLNDDHFPDLVALSNGQVEVFLGKGDGTFASGATYFAGTGPASLLAADFNNDGHIDLAVTSQAGLGILLGQGDGTFSSVTFSTAQGLGSLFVAADFNADGKVDLIAGGPLILLGNGDGTFSAQSVFQNKATAGSTILAGAADFNGDGKLDLFGVQDQGYMWMTLGNGNGTFVQNPLLIGFGNIYLALAADFNLDHRPDLAIGDSTNVFDRHGTVSTGVATLLNVSAPPNPPGFHLSSAALLPSSLTAGGSASSTITVTPTSGFAGDVTFSCTSITLNGSLPSTAPPVCSFAPNPVKAASGATSLKVTTTAASARLLMPLDHYFSWAFAICVPVGMATLFILPTGTFKKRLAQPRVLGLLSFLLLLMLCSCGGGSSSPNGNASGGGGGGTPPGTYNLVVTATSGSISQSVTLTLTVK
jgi:FG-GAP-like repeat